MCQKYCGNQIPEMDYLGFLMGASLIQVKCLAHVNWQLRDVFAAPHDDELCATTIKTIIQRMVAAQLRQRIECLLHEISVHIRWGRTLCKWGQSYHLNISVSFSYAFLCLPCEWCHS